VDPAQHGSELEVPQEKQKAAHTGTLMRDPSSEVQIRGKKKENTKLQQNQLFSLFHYHNGTKI